MANQNLSQFGEKLFVADADHTFIWDSAASISKRVSRNSWLNSGTLTSDAPVTISQTWAGTGSTVFTALKVNATTPETTSSTSSLLLDLQVGGTSIFKVDRSGSVTLSYASGLFISPSNRVRLGNNSTDAVEGLFIGNTSYIGFINGANSNLGSDSKLYGESLNTLALRNGAAAQTFRVYGAYPDTGINYARLALSCDTSGNATISTQALGTYTAGTVSINGVPVGRGKGSNTARNISIGDNSLGLNSTGVDNTAVGFYALGANGTGNYNTSFGSQSLFSSNSNHNVALGYLAGTFKAGGATNNPGNENIYIGSQTKALDTAQTNQIVIGYDATGIGSNSVVLGNDSITKTALKGNVGIGTTAPTAPLDVFKSAAGADATGGGLSVLRSTATGDHRGGAIYSRFISGGSADFLVFGVTGVSGKNPYTDFDQARMVIGHTGNVGIGTTSPTSKLQVSAGDVEVDTIAKGVILKSPDGTRYRVTVANGGTLSVAAV